MNTRMIRFLFGATIALMICLLFFFLPMPTSSAPAIGGLSIYVTTAADEFDISGSGTGCALREAIKLANDYFPPTFINFGGCSVSGTSGLISIYVPSGTYTLTLTGANEDADVTGDLDITNTMTISATGAVIVTGNTGWDDRIFHIVSGSVKIKGIEIRGGSTTVIIGNHGGGIYNAGIATLTDMVLNSNSAFAGGGIYNVGTLTLMNATLSGNSTLSGDLGNVGGGMVNAGTAMLTNVTFSGNSADYYGGGIYNAGTLMLTNTTLSGNSAFVSGGGIYWASGLGGITNTIVANSLIAGNCNASFGASFNLSSDNTCGFGAGRDNINVMLGPLANNGGSMQTHALLPGSPAINFGTNTGCPSTDQRGVPRPIGPFCDVGAYEFAGPFVYLPLILR